MSAIIMSVKRSAEWVKQQRIEKAENVPDYVDKTCELSEFSVAMRSWILAYKDGNYPVRLDSFSYDSELEPCQHASFGRFWAIVDSYAPTEAEIEGSIQAQLAALEVRRQARQKDMAARKEKEDALAAARILLIDEINQRKNRIEALEEENATLRREALRRDNNEDEDNDEDEDK